MPDRTHVLLALTYEDARAWIATHPELDGCKVITSRSHWFDRLRGIRVGSWSHTSRAPEHSLHTYCARYLDRLVVHSNDPD